MNLNMKEMPLRKKIGQLMMFGFHGTKPSKEILQMIEEEHVGGVILFSRNIGTPEEVLHLTSELQNAAKRAAHPFPLLISIDQENGIVRRLGSGTTVFPGSMLLGAINDVEATERIAKATAEELKALGVNMNLAPVVDINNNPFNPVIGVRSFGETAEQVTRHGLASIKGHQAAGIIATVKHFPGHGDTDTDSHLDLPTIFHDLERLKQVELVPFQRAIDDGTDCVMISHVYFPALESRNNLPATLSKSLVNDLLRKQMGFDGVVTTDCLEMNAISKTVGTVEGALQAFIAGNDILMISHTFTYQKEAIERMVSAVENGEIDEEMIDQAVQRILNLKEKYLSWDRLPKMSDGIPSFVGGKDHQELAQRQFKRGVTLIRNKNILPLKLTEQDQLFAILPKSRIQTKVEDEDDSANALGSLIRNHHSNVHEYQISTELSDEEMEEAISLASTAKAVIVGTVNAHLYQRQAQLVNEMIKGGKKVIVIAMRNPYDLMNLPDVTAFIAAYEYTLPAFKAAVDIIFGVQKPSGRLPVTLPGYASIGFGLKE